MVILFPVLILGLAVSAFLENPGLILKRNTHLDVKLNPLYRRQLGACASECSSVASVLTSCNATTQCVCSTINSAGPTAVTACVTCLEPIAPSIASNISLVAEVCSMCQNQCSKTLDSYIQTLSCNSTQCSCAAYALAGASEITTCANCVSTFSPPISTGLLEFAQECGIVPPTSASASASASGSAAPSGSTSQSAGTASTSVSASASGSSHSAASRVVGEVLSKLLWMTIFVGVFGFVYVLA